MLVHHPHNFRGVHWGTATQCDDHIRFEGVRQFSAFTYNAQGWVSFNFKEDFSFDASRFQNRGDLVCIAIVEQETVGHDERTFVAISNHFIQRDWQRAAAEVDRFRKFVPQHVFSSLSNGFLVDQVFWTNVFRDGVTTPGATTQSQGRCEFEVVKVTDTTLRSRGVDQDTCRLHLLTEVSNTLRLVILVGVQARGVADTAHRHQLLCFIYRVIEIFRTVHCQRRGEFLVSKRLTFINDFHFTNQNLGGSRDAKASELSDFIRRLTYDSRVQRTIFQNHVLNGFQFFTLQQVAAVAGETFTNGVVYRINHDNRLFRCTDNAVIEGFRHQHRGNSTLDISRFVDHHRGITCAYADGWFTGAVRCFNHTRTTGRQNQVNVRVMHQGVGQFNRRLVDPADEIFWCTRRNSSLKHDICCFVGGVLRTWMRGENDCVTCLQTDERFEDGGRGWVSGWNDTANDADRFCDGDGAESIVF
ncbi:Uncharacterised protein [Enterobacter hormaechei]|nr:Uncharacterised protein [Enterobacter hormaechei]